MTLLLAQVAQRSRVAWGIVAAAIIIDGEWSKVVKAMQGEGAAFSQGAGALKGEIKELQGKFEQCDEAAREAALKELQTKLQKYGPPAPCVFAAMVKALAQSEIGRVNREGLGAQ
eukprot:2370286-Pyramimonas_sp.AAC.1